jgi:acetyl-CoA decarbonylase/synthase complex subunit delta
MPLKKVSQKFSASIQEVVIGTGAKAVKLGGECTFPLYTFDAPTPNKCRIGVEVVADGSASAEVVDRAKKAAGLPGADFVSLYFEMADPNGKNASVDDCAAIAKAVSDAIDVPLAIQGCKNVEKDSELFTKVAETLQGKNILLLSAKEENHKAVAAAGVLAYGQKIGAESAVDLNLAKQLNVLIGQVGVKNESLVMNVGQAAAGYGFEYVVSTMDRVRAAALDQNDVSIQVPMITPVSQETDGVKESVVAPEDAPSPAWGTAEERCESMEVATAAMVIGAGSDAVILRNPKAVETIAKFINELA